MDKIKMYTVLDELKESRENLIEEINNNEELLINYYDEVDSLYNHYFDLKKDINSSSINYAKYLVKDKKGSISYKDLIADELDKMLRLERKIKTYDKLINEIEKVIETQKDVLNKFINDLSLLDKIIAKLRKNPSYEDGELLINKAHERGWC